MFEVVWIIRYMLIITHAKFQRNSDSKCHLIIDFEIFALLHYCSGYEVRTFSTPRSGLGSHFTDLNFKNFFLELLKHSISCHK